MKTNLSKIVRTIAWSILIYWVIQRNLAIAGVATSLVAGLSTNTSMQFKPGTAEILPESFDLLRLYGKLLLEFSSTAMVIVGHADNQKLSEKRAEAVKQFFVSEFGIDEERLIAIGLGDSMPIADNSTEEGQAKNRRVQFLCFP